MKFFFIIIEMKTFSRRNIYRYKLQLKHITFSKTLRKITSCTSKVIIGYFYIIYLMLLKSYIPISNFVLPTKTYFGYCKKYFI